MPLYRFWSSTFKIFEISFASNRTFYFDFKFFYFFSHLFILLLEICYFFHLMNYCECRKIKLLKISKHQKPQQPQQPQQPYQSIPVNAYKAPYVEVAVNLAPVEVISTIQPAKNQEVDEQPNDSKPSNDHVEPIYPSLNV